MRDEVRKRERELQEQACKVGCASRGGGGRGEKAKHLKRHGGTNKGTQIII